MRSVAKYLAAGALSVAAIVMYFHFSETGSKRPFEEMTFSEHFDDVVGDEEGVVCHQIVIRDGRSPERRVVSHMLLGKDFRKMTLEEKKAVIIADTDKDMEDAGLACVGPDGRPFLSPAYAQKQNPGGGGCTAHSCNASLTGSTCVPSGLNCVLTVICCPGCPPGC